MKKRDSVIQNNLTRRGVLGALAGSAASLTLGTRLVRSQAGGRPKPHVLVVGAGAFGGWTALHLLRSGAKVTLVDAWGPGNARASSGGETRNMIGMYGSSKMYVDRAARALELWLAHERLWDCRLYERLGALWMMPEQEGEAGSGAGHIFALEPGMTGIEELSRKQAKTRYPQINFEGISWAFYERDAGYLKARYACQKVLEGFLKEGGEYRQLAVTSYRICGGEMNDVTFADGSQLKADMFVFACGPWLGKLFPTVIGDLVAPSRQEAYYFGTPPGDKSYSEGQLPHWVDWGDAIWYGLPAHMGKGFKVGDDTRGPAFDPTSGNRQPTEAEINRAREYIGFRFPGLKNAPFLEGRVCQYENSPDGHYIIDKHPAAQNTWIVGGGSGTAFHAGPALGEEIAGHVLEKTKPDPSLSLSRFEI